MAALSYSDKDIRYQQWLLGTIYPTMDEEHRDKLRETVSTWSKRDGVDHFSDGKMIAKAAETISYSADLDEQYPVPLELRIELFGSMAPSLVNGRVAYTIPSSLYRAIRNTKRKALTLATIGYGQGQIESALLRGGMAVRALGLEFSPGVQEEKLYLQFLQELVGAVKGKYGTGTALSTVMQKSLADYLCCHVPAPRYGVNIQKIAPFVPEMLAKIPDDLSKMVHTYRIRMEAIAGSSQDHPQFEKKVLNLQENSLEDCLQAISIITTQSDIVLFKDSLHHSPTPLEYFWSAYSAMPVGSRLIVIDPFLFEENPVDANLLRVAFETSIHPMSLLTIRQHERWINQAILAGGRVEFHSLHYGLQHMSTHFDPYHRFQICIRKRYQKEIPQLQGDFLPAEQQEAERWVEEAILQRMIPLLGPNPEKDFLALVSNRLFLAGLCRDNHIPEQNYFCLGHRRVYGKKPFGRWVE